MHVCHVVWITPVLERTRLNQGEVTGFTEHFPVQRIAAVVVWLWGELGDADLRRANDELLFQGHRNNMINCRLSTVPHCSSVIQKAHSNAWKKIDNGYIIHNVHTKKNKSL